MTTTKIAPPPLKKDIVNIAAHNIATVAKNDSGLYLDNDNVIPATVTYKSEDGDIVVIHRDGKNTIVSIINESMLTDMSDEVFVETATRKPRIKQILNTTGENINLCEISLGNWRNKVSKENDILSLVMGKRTYYDKTTGEELENDKSGNVEYKTIIMCSTAKRDEAINTLKAIFAHNEKIAVEWFIEQ